MEVDDFATSPGILKKKRGTITLNQGLSGNLFKHY